MLFWTARAEEKYVMGHRKSPLFLTQERIKQDYAFSLGISLGEKERHSAGSSEKKKSTEIIRELEIFTLEEILKV